MPMDPYLVNKYNIPVPRYTSYPTVPYWKDVIDAEKWKSVFEQQFHLSNSKEGISLYIHLPFCESLCTYCGCNKKITTNHSVESEYLNALIQEWSIYRQLMYETPVIREFHFGGGTPTFFSPKNLARIANTIFERSLIHPKHEFSIEGHPNNTTRKHLETLYNLGFRRISYGVQDNNPEVQQIINRIQPYENVIRAMNDARETGFKSINFDLIYGLPKQTISSIEKTINQVIELRPDRIAFYSYAHVPWTSRGQRLFNENDLPGASEKLALYLKGKQLLTEAGYVDIGMDHFALPEDDLYKSWIDGALHRNFMGYTTQKTTLLLGLGVSSISDSGLAFAQNKKDLHGYYEHINKRELAVTRGYFLDKEDLAFRKYILDLSCKNAVVFNSKDLSVLQEYTFPELLKLEKDRLVEWNENEMSVTPIGRHFIRNICRAFDLYLLRNQQAEKKDIFSKAI